MENSLTSLNKALSSTKNGKTTENPPEEESSWTFYMQDFLYADDHHNSTSSFSYQTSPSLVSDACSSAARNASDKNEPISKFTSNSSFKRLKAAAKGLITAVNDHDLEDTASSPANSPRDTYINQLHDNHNEKDNIIVSQVNISRNINAEVVGNAEGEIISNQSELKKMGLCLVPVSMLTNHLG